MEGEALIILLVEDNPDHDGGRWCRKCFVKRDAFKILSFRPGGCEKNSPMLRLARCEAPGGFHHIMFRGIECREIFSNNEEREDLTARFAKELGQA